LLHAFLLHRTVLWLLVWVNGLGTLYGYYWYAQQLKYTYETKPLWMLPFVPDSPTASLFFTLALLFLLYARKNDSPNTMGQTGAVRSFVEAMACTTSFKYGIWAVVMIFAGAYRGNELIWQDWMLVISHTGMAIEAVLYARYFIYGRIALLFVAAWTILNDVVDYTKGVFPWLPKELHGDLYWISYYTFSMSLLSLAIMFILAQLRKKPV
jgi:uncharacterized membrane protein YpjA